MPNAQRIVLVTGAFGALGGALTQRFLGKNAFVIAFGSPHREPAHGVAPDLVFNPDLSDPAQVQEAMNEIAAQLPCIDVLINVAGGFALDDIDKPALEVWDEMLSKNLKTVVCVCKMALPLLKKSANERIINIAAAAALGSATFSNTAYLTSKLGVIKFTEALASGFAKDRITANAILPMTIDTPANRASMPTADFSKWVTMDQISDAIELLASESAQTVSGAAIRVGR
jgi:NAD(P)-dependent dehydrogenase (short-subunit alcohol dehydrogenase family)